MKWYFAHVPRAAGVNADERQNNWFKYIFDFQSYDAKGQLLPAAAELCSGDVADPKTATHTLRVAYRSGNHIDPTSLSDDDLAVTGPDGKPLAVKLIGGNEPAGRSYRVARYEVTAPGGSWDRSPSTMFSVALRPDRVRTAAGVALRAGRLGGFRVARAGGAAEEQVADADTTLLAHFEEDGRSGRIVPDLAKGLRYVPGVVGRGASIGPGAELRYRCKGVLDPKAGSVEFWLRPSWDGNAGKSHVFFQAGEPFNNGLIVQIDGANNLRLMVWGDDPATPAVEQNVERGVGTSAAGWKAGEWHHVAATWEDSGRRLALYVDGRPADTTNNGIVLRQFSRPIFWVGSGAGGEAPAEAVVDELRTSRRARTEAEIRSAAAATGGVETLTVDVPPASLLPGGREVARAVGRTKAGLPQDLTRDVAWTSSDPAVATVDSDGTLRAVRAGEAKLTARLGALTATATVKVLDAHLPQAHLVRATDVSRPGAGDVMVVVAFDAPAGIRPGSIGQGNVAVVGPNGLYQFPEPVSAKAAAVGRGVLVSYRVVPPTGKWREADRGVYTIAVKGLQVSDIKGNYAAETVLGRFRVLQPPERR